MLGDVDYAMDVERNLLSVGAPVLIAEAVKEFAVLLGIERVVAVGYILLEGLVLAVGELDLQMGEKKLPVSYVDHLCAW